MASSSTLRLLLAGAAVAAAAVQTAAAPIVIGHRGASGYRPEHTLEAYALAIDMGADFIEPDLVSTKDGILIARHENDLARVDANGNVTESSTDVAFRAEFADRKKTKTVDGVNITGWFTEDFTLAEIKTLNAKERIPQLRPANQTFAELVNNDLNPNNNLQVPTLQEVIDLVKAKEAQTGRTIGIYPETKHPTYFDSIGLSMEEPLVAVLNANGYNGPQEAVFIQSFEVANLIDLKTKTNLPLVQLINNTAGGSRPYDVIAAGGTLTYAQMVTPAGLDAINDYAVGIGSFKNNIIPRNAAGNLLSPTSLVADAHAKNLLVHTWTMRSENFFLPTNMQTGAPIAKGNYAAEYAAFFATGIDGVFSDHPDDAVAARNAFVAAAAVPEPGTLALLASGSLGLMGTLARRRKH